MTERGGPTAQSIVYQNKIAGLYLGDLLSFDSDSRHRVTEVRVEAPAHVDDVVVRYADGHRLWIQVKLALTLGSAAWNKLWRDLHEQRQVTATAETDRLALIVGEASGLTELMQDCAARTTGSPDAEWRCRLSEACRALVTQIECLLAASPYPIFERLRVETITEDALETSVVKLRMPASNVGARTLHNVLTTVASDAGLRRATLNARELRALLRSREIPVVVEPPQNWGLPAYLRILAKARISVPGTSVGGDASTSFCWPRTALTEEFQRDFDDEQELEKLEEEPEAIDLKLFPTPDCSQAIIHAGPGFGKSALLAAVAQRLAIGGYYTPAIIPLAAFADKRQDLLSFLDGALNSEFGVNIDWIRLLETGAAVILFDGFDEIPSTRRSFVTDQVAIFMARFPETPWLLSVRDPDYVPAKIDARKVELLPLLDREMRSFIEHVSPGIHERDVERLTTQIKAYPDLQRLVRIPLFLALLVATQRPGVALPSRRSELIEAYLTTLFRPEEHKATARLRDSELLRDALQALAYDLLKRGQIGVNEHAVRRLFKRFANERIAVDDLMDDAKSCGILRREGGSRLNFPFPIVQEYLAAQHLVEEHFEEIAQRVASGINRPWAQAIQFALEQMDDASLIARELLAKPDDPFASAVRMLARCVINGMRCDMAVRADIGDRLMTAWPDQSFWTTRRIGRLLQDGWTRPLVPRLRQLILKRSFFYDGGGDILAELLDEMLTLEFLRSALEADWLPPHLGEFQVAVDAVAPRAFALYIDSVRQGLWSQNRLWEASTVIQRLNGQEIPEADLVAAIEDDTLPVGVRLACLSLSRQPDERLLMELAVAALRLPRASDQWSVMHALRVVADPEARLAQLLRRNDLHEIAHNNIIEHIDDCLIELPRQIAFLRYQAGSDDLSDALRLQTRVWAAILGDADTISSLIEDFGRLPENVLRPVIWSINKTPRLEDGKRLAGAMRARDYSAEQRAIMIGDLMFGATHNIKAFSWHGCTMESTKPHIAFPFFVDLLADWRQMGGYDLTSKLRIETEACRARLPGAGEALLRLANDIALNEDLSGKDNELYLVLRNAMRQMEKHRLLLSLPAAIRLTEIVEPIERQATLSHIGAMGTREALNYLLTWSGELGYQKSVVLHGIEQTSARLGIKIIRDGERLAIAF